MARLDKDPAPAASHPQPAPKKAAGTPAATPPAKPIITDYASL